MFFICSTINGHWVVFILGLLVIHAALDSCTCTLVHISMHFCSIFLEDELLVHTDMTFYHAIFQSIEMLPLTGEENSHCSITLAIFVIVRVFNFCQSDGYIVLSYCRVLVLHFPMFAG